MVQPDFRQTEKGESLRGKAVHSRSRPANCLWFPPPPQTPSGIGTLSSERILDTSRGRCQLCGKLEQATQGPGHLAPPPRGGPSAKYWSSRGPPVKTSGPMPPLVQTGKQCLLELTAQTGRSWALVCPGRHPAPSRLWCSESRAFAHHPDGGPGHKG